MRIAIVHPWVTEWRGAERVFFEIARIFPEATLHVLFARRAAVAEDLLPRLNTGYLQRLQGPRGAYRFLLPALPRAVEALQLDGYDLVISSSYGWAHGVKIGAGARHLCYMHGPPRYLWGARAPTASGRAAQHLLSPLIDRLRDWDLAASRGVDHFLANSETTAGRVERAYGRQAQLLYPPVRVEHFLSLERRPADYVLYVGELVPYKRPDRVIRACLMLGVPLHIVGDGPERGRLQELARGGNVTFLGRAPDAVRDAELAGAAAFAYGGVEDFGLVFVEALASGVPIAGPGAGGLAEIGRDGGVAFAAEESAEALANAIAFCLQRPEEYLAREQAMRFDISVFRDGLLAQLACLTA